MTTDDLGGLELRIEKAMSALALGIEKSFSKTRLTNIVLWLITMIAVVVTNPKALDLIMRLSEVAR